MAAELQPDQPASAHRSFTSDSDPPTALTAPVSSVAMGRLGLPLLPDSVRRAALALRDDDAEAANRFLSCPHPHLKGNDISDSTARYI